jgi:hypothetical protein
MEGDWGGLAQLHQGDQGDQGHQGPVGESKNWDAGDGDGRFLLIDEPFWRLRNAISVDTRDPCGSRMLIAAGSRWSRLGSLRDR